MQKFPRILTGLYVALLVLSVIPIFTGDDALSGVFAVVLAAPWAMFFGSLVESSGERISTGIAIVVIGGLINAALISFVSRWFVRKFCK